MKSLILTTGRQSWIEGIWYPSLRDSKNGGDYQGDVLIVDYADEIIDDRTGELVKSNPFTLEFLYNLYKDKNVIYRVMQRKYCSFASDRIYQFYKLIKEEKEYDTILITDGTDIEFLKPIQPLLEMASKELCLSAEEESNMAIRSFRCLPKFPKEEIDYILHKPIINAGMIAGPRKEILALFEKIIENYEMYGAEFGSEQLTINILVYYYSLLTKNVGATWNYTMVSNRRKKYRFPPATGEEYGKQIDISIIHSNGHALGRYLGKLNGKVRKRYLNGEFTNPMTLGSSGSLFPIHVIPKRKEGGLFPKEMK